MKINDLAREADEKANFKRVAEQKAREEIARLTPIVIRSLYNSRSKIYLNVETDGSFILDERGTKTNRLHIKIFTEKNLPWLLPTLKILWGETKPGEHKSNCCFYPVDDLQNPFLLASILKELTAHV